MSTSAIPARSTMPDYDNRNPVALPTRRRNVRLKARRILHALLLLSAAASVGGCNTTSHNEDLTVGSVPTDYRVRHPIVVREADRKMEMFIGSRRGSLTPSQRSEVVAFADVWRREATAGMIIEVPVGTPNAHAASESVRDIRGVLASVGVPPAAVATRSYRPADPSELATVRLIYPRMVARAGPCGQWPQDLGPGSGVEHTLNDPYFNLGCAYQRNMAAMVANPADLVQPRGEGPGLTSRRSGALEKYRKGEPTATNYPDAKATISDVGK